MHSASCPVGSAVAAAFMFVNAAPMAGQQFFGEDLGFRAPVTAPANATEAYDGFSSLLNWSSSEDFESSWGLPTGVGEIVPNGTVAVTDASERHAARKQRHAGSGTRFLAVGEGEFTLTFASPVHAFGFSGIDVGDAGDELFLTVMRASSAVETIVVPHSRGARYSGSRFFFGLVDQSDAITSVVFSKNGQKDLFSFDDFVVGGVAPANVATPSNVTPEPVSSVLLATGLLGLAVVGRRRRERGEIPG